MLMPYITMEETKTSPLFSVIIPTLGKTTIWLEAIRSVREQTCTDWEIIAVDSGPEAISKPLIEAIGDSRIIYINTALGNPKLNWDTGYRGASGQYILWLDDDNYLLPHALQTLKGLIDERSPRTDFVTANHMHWNDLHHPIENIRNHLVVPKRLFSGALIDIDPKNAVRKLFGIPYEGDRIYARFHHTAQAIRKEVVDSFISKIGAIDFGSTSTHALRIGMLALSKSVRFADIPVALIGQSGKSLSMVWPNQSSAIKQAPYQYHLSEVHANTYINYVHENHLLLKKYLADDLRAFTLPRASFLSAHAHSLIYLKLTWKELFRFWGELFTIVAQSTEPDVTALRGKIYRSFVLACLAKLLRLIGLYGIVQTLFSFKRLGGKAHYEQILIPLAPYHVESMHTCAEALPRVIEEYFKQPYKQFMRIEKR